MSERARVIVVGSGPAGAAAAVFLARAGADVLVLEAGAERLARGLTVRAGGFTVFKRSRVLKPRPGVVASADPNAEYFEDLAPGGLSNHWSCAVPRFSPEDFDGRGARRGRVRVADRVRRSRALVRSCRAAAPHRGCGRRLAPVARGAGPRRTELEGRLGQARCRSAQGRANHRADAVRLRRRDVGDVQRDGVQRVRSSGRARAARRSISARFEARVVRLEWSKSRASGRRRRRSRRENGGEDRIACRAVVLAAGAIGTPEILLASTSAEFPDGLGNTHGALGHYLHDHPLGKLIVDLGTPVSALPPSYLTRRTLDDSPPLYAAACMQWSGTEILVESRLKGKHGRLPWLGFSVFGTMAPSKNDWVALDPAKNRAAGATGLDLHIRHPPEARVALEAARDDLLKVLERGGLAPRIRGWLVEPVGNSRHYGGACRMHASPELGMIDAWSRLHAAPNVAGRRLVGLHDGAREEPRPHDDGALGACERPSRRRASRGRPLSVGRTCREIDEAARVTK